MKRKFTILLCCFFISTLAYSQKQTDGGFYEYEGNGYIQLTDGTKREGVIYFALSWPGKVRLVKEGKDEKYSPKEVSAFVIDGARFVPIKTSDALNVASSELSYARLMNDENSRIKIYMYQEQAIISTNNYAPTQTSYYIEVPALEKVLAIGDLKFVGSKKVAAYLKDCPALAEKIEKKADGYSYGMISSDQMKLMFWEKVAKEYDACK